MSRMSISTISNPEFINLKPLDINPLMSECEIKVLYLGKNRNHSIISKEVATEMAKTLRGAPIVGWFREEKEDFGDHGERIIFEGNEIKFDCLTKPYGFVAPNANVWFQKFEEINELGETVIREYMMTTGYLWTGQFEECKVAATEDGRPHSMELDKDTLQGSWTEDLNSGIEFFIINDAIFSKLCILGEDVEPCFEGSSVTAPNISHTFSAMTDEFKRNLYTMMQDLTFALEGGKDMDNDVKNNVSVEPETQVTEVPNADADANVAYASKKKEEEQKEENKEKTSSENKEDPKEKEDPENNKETPEDEEEKKKKGVSKSQKQDDEEKKKQSKCSLEEYSALEEKYNKLEGKYSSLEKDYQSLVEFKNQIENEKKDVLIKSFYMLSDEDKKDVIENKSNYPLDEIEAKLSVICCRKKVSFDLEDKKAEVQEEVPATTFNLSDANDGAPAWITAARNAKNNRNN